MTRLLNTPIIGPSATNVASSWIDMLAGLSGVYIFRMPPAFWADADWAATPTSAAISNAPRYGFISVHLPFIVARPIVGTLIDLHRQPSAPEWRDEAAYIPVGCAAQDWPPIRVLAPQHCAVRHRKPASRIGIVGKD